MKHFTTFNNEIKITMVVMKIESKLSFSLYYAIEHLCKKRIRKGKLMTQELKTFVKLLKH